MTVCNSFNTQNLEIKYTQIQIWVTVLHVKLMYSGTLFIKDIKIC